MENSMTNNLAKSGQTIADVAARAQSMGKQGLGAVSDAASQASDTIIGYAKENPVKALLIAAASGALVVSLIKMLTPSRD